MKSLATFLIQQRRWSTETFGPYNRPRLMGIIDHLDKELDEVRADPTDLEEWIDLLILAMDGALCAATAPLMEGDWQERQSVEAVEAMLEWKRSKNSIRKWPAREDQVAGKAVEHIREVPDPVLEQAIREVAGDPPAEPRSTRHVATGRVVTFPTEPVVDRKCTKCDGCGKIADSEDGEPWTDWTILPLQSAMAVTLGLVKPITCPECHGTGIRPWLADAERAGVMAMARAVKGGAETMDEELGGL